MADHTADIKTIVDKHSDTSEPAQAACQEAMKNIYNDLKDNPTEWAAVQKQIKENSKGEVYIDDHSSLLGKHVTAGYKPIDIPIVSELTKVEFFDSNNQHEHDEHKYESKWDPTGAAGALNKVSEVNIKKTSG